MIRNFMQLMIANEEKEKNLAQGLADKPSGSMRNLSKQKSSGSMRNLRKQKSTKSMEGDTCPNDASITKDAPSEAAAPSEEKQKRQIRHVAHGVSIALYLCYHIISLYRIVSIPSYCAAILCGGSKKQDSES